MIDSNSELFVQFRYIGVPSNVGEFGCIGLFYENHNAADAIVRNLQTYFMASPVHKHSNVAATTDKSGLISLSVEYSWQGEHDDRDHNFLAELNGIDPNEFMKIVKTLETFTAYGVLIGYESHDGPQIISPKELSIFRANLHLDGEDITATGNNPPPELY